MILDDNNGIMKLGKSSRPEIIKHQDMEQYLGRYAGLMLYLKEMDEGVYGKLCAVRHSFSYPMSECSPRYRLIFLRRVTCIANR